MATATTLQAEFDKLNGWMALEIGLEEIPLIVDGMGYRYRRRLERVDLIKMVRDSDTTGIAPNDRESFKRADAVVETTDGDGRKRYVAIEISFKSRKRDVDRAIRNAEYLARFTGVPTSAAVAGVEMSDEIRAAVDAGDVFWHELVVKVLQPE